MSSLHTNAQKEECERLIYALKLEKDFWYIGTSMVRTFQDRLKLHFKRKGSAWTKLYQPEKIVYASDIHVGNYRDLELIENEITVKYMKKYGIDNVRGGFFASRSTPIEIRKNLTAHGYDVERIDALTK